MISTLLLMRRLSSSTVRWTSQINCKIQANIDIRDINRAYLGIFMLTIYICSERGSPTSVRFFQAKYRSTLSRRLIECYSTSSSEGWCTLAKLLDWPFIKVLHQTTSLNALLSQQWELSRHAQHAGENEHIVNMPYLVPSINCRFRASSHPRWS